MGIDGELLAAHVSRLQEITGGCVCCSSQAELISALRELSESTPPPRRILVETSGAASPAGVIRGIAAPGMPMGSPGMEGPNPVEYDIVAHHTDGTTSVYATRQGKEKAD